MARIHFFLTRLYVSSLILLSSGQAVAHQWDTPVPHLAERMQLVITGNCPNCTLSDADLSYKELAGTTLTGADLRQANFMRTGLKDAILIGKGAIWAVPGFYKLHPLCKMRHRCVPLVGRCLTT